MRDAILDEVTDAAGESSKIPRLQRVLQEFDENFNVIGLINFNWEHTTSKPLSSLLARAHCAPEQEHHHQEQVCSSLSGWPGGDTQTVRHGTEDHTSVATAQTERPGHAQSPEDCTSAMANTCRNEIVNRVRSS